MLFQMKKYSSKLLTPVGRKISKVPANYITLCSLISCIIVFFAFTYQFFIVAATFLFLIEFFDQLDGIVARLQGSTDFGAFLDSTLDRYGDVFLFLGLILGGYTDSILVILALVGALFTSYTRARIEALGVTSLGGIGLLERTDRIPLLLIGTFIQFWVPSALHWTVIVLIIGSHFTAFQRIYFAYKHLSKTRKQQN